MPSATVITLILIGIVYLIYRNRNNRINNEFQRLYHVAPKGKIGPRNTRRKEPFSIEINEPQFTFANKDKSPDMRHSQDKNPLKSRNSYVNTPTHTLTFENPLAAYDMGVGLRLAGNDVPLEYWERKIVEHRQSRYKTSQSGLMHKDVVSLCAGNHVKLKNAVGNVLSALNPDMHVRSGLTCDFTISDDHGSTIDVYMLTRDTSPGMLQEIYGKRMANDEKNPILFVNLATMSKGGYDYAHKINAQIIEKQLINETATKLGMFDDKNVQLPSNTPALTRQQFIMEFMTHLPSEYTSYPVQYMER